MSPNGKINKKHPFTRIKRRIRLTYLKIMRIDDPPEKIAGGAAIGVLMGVLPTFGIGTFLSLGFAFLFKVNKAAAVLGSFIVNPLTSPFFWALSISVGSLIMREDSASILERIKGEGFLSGAGWAYVVFLVGNAIVSAVCTTAAYYLIKQSVIRHRRHKAAKMLEKVRKTPHHF